MVQLMTLPRLNAMEYYIDYNVCIISYWKWPKNLSLFEKLFINLLSQASSDESLIHTKHQSFALKLGLFLAWPKRISCFLGCRAELQGYSVFYNNQTS